MTEKLIQSQWGYLEKRKDWQKRTILAVVLFLYFFLMIYVGPPLILASMLAIQIKTFSEIMKIGYSVNSIREEKIAYFRVFNWYFLIAANYFFYGEALADHMDALVQKYLVLEFLLRYHRFFSFCFYFVGIVWFVFSLVKKKEIKKRFSLLSWTHFLLIIIVFQSYMNVEITFQGLIWYITSMLVVIANDIFAYIFGKLMGKTPLIQVSPKKTQEGFVYSGIATVLFIMILSNILCRFDYFVCPIEYVSVEGSIRMMTNCSRTYIFQPYPVSFFNVSNYPFVYHSVAMALFASIVAPFGGFFASGFKRAIGIKDFDNFLPGHGGMTDRFDCSFLMATFANVYIRSFIATPQVEKVYQKVLYMSEDKQLEFYRLFESYLVNSGMLNSTLY